MKSKNLHLAMLMVIGLLAGTISVAAQNPSSWAVGTFVGRNPNTGNRIRLTIESNGNVSARVERNTNYGRVKKDRMTINGETARLYKTNNGIRTVSQSSGETIEYVRGNGGWNTGNNDWDDNWNWGGGGNNGQQGRVPDWAQGTWYGVDPRSNRVIQLTIDRSGNANINVDGGQSYGKVYQQTLTVNGESSSISRSRNGISTRNNRNGETITYSKTMPSGGWWGNGNNNQQGRVPDWAVGTFWATNPQNGQMIEMTIGSDGRVSVNFGGGSYTYGSVYRETLTINGESATLSRTRNGIATTKNSNGERIEYRRR